MKGEGCDKETMVLLLSCWKIRPHSWKFHSDDRGHQQSDPAQGGRSSYWHQQSIGNYLFLPYFLDLTGLRKCLFCLFQTWSYGNLHRNWSHRVGASLIYFISLSAANYVSQAELRAAVKFIQQQGHVFSSRGVSSASVTWRSTSTSASPCDCSRKIP